VFWTPQHLRASSLKIAREVAQCLLMFAGLTADMSKTPDLAHSLCFAVLTCLSQCPLSRTVVCVLTRAVSHHGVVCGCARSPRGRAEQRRSLDLAAQKQPRKCSTFHRRHVTSQQWLSRTCLVSRLCLVQRHSVSCCLQKIWSLTTIKNFNASHQIVSDGNSCYLFVPFVRWC